MNICLGTGGKARNSGLLAKGAADWSAAGARLKDFLFKKGSESGPPSDISTWGGWQLAPCPPKVTSKTPCVTIFWPPSENPIIYYVLVTLGVPCESLWGPWCSPRSEQNLLRCTYGLTYMSEGFQKVCQVAPRVWKSHSKWPQMATRVPQICSNGLQKHSKWAPGINNLRFFWVNSSVWKSRGGPSSK